MSDKCKCTHDIEQHNGFSGATTCEVRGCPCRRFTPAESASPSAPERFPIDKTDEYDMRDRPAAPATPQLDGYVEKFGPVAPDLQAQLSAALSEVATLKKEAAEMKRQRDMLLNSDRHVAISSLQAEVAALREENERLRLNYYPGTSALYVPKAAYEVLKTQLADSQKKMDALLKALREIETPAGSWLTSRGDLIDNMRKTAHEAIAIAEERAKQ